METCVLRITNEAVFQMRVLAFDIYNDDIPVTSKPRDLDDIYWHRGPRGAADNVTYALDVYFRYRISRLFSIYLQVPYSEAGWRYSSICPLPLGFKAAMCSRYV